MPLSIVDVSAADFLAWDEILQALADVVTANIKPNVTGARIYPNWIYEIDITTMLGKVTGEMRATSGTSNGKVHCVCMGISGAQFELNQSGDVPEIGARSSMWKWILSIDVWSFREYDGTNASQKAAQDEARLIGAAIYRNAIELVEQIPKLSEIKPLQYPPGTIQPTPMSGGTLVTVAGGVMQAVVDEALAI